MAVLTFHSKASTYERAVDWGETGESLSALLPKHSDENCDQIQPIQWMTHPLWTTMLASIPLWIWLRNRRVACRAVWSVINWDLYSIFSDICSIFPACLHTLLPLTTTLGNSLSIFGSGAESMHGLLLGGITCDFSLVYKEFFPQEFPRKY